LEIKNRPDARRGGDRFFQYTGFNAIRSKSGQPERPGGFRTRRGGGEETDTKDRHGELGS